MWLCIIHDHQQGGFFTFFFLNYDPQKEYNSCTCVSGCAVCLTRWHFWKFWQDPEIATALNCKCQICSLKIRRLSGIAGLLISGDWLSNKSWERQDSSLCPRMGRYFLPRFLSHSSSPVLENLCKIWVPRWTCSYLSPKSWHQFCSLLVLGIPVPWVIGASGCWCLLCFSCCALCSRMSPSWVILYSFECNNLKEDGKGRFLTQFDIQLAQSWLLNCRQCLLRSRQNRCQSSSPSKHGHLEKPGMIGFGICCQINRMGTLPAWERIVWGSWILKKILLDKCMVAPWLKWEISPPYLQWKAVCWESRWSQCSPDTPRSWHCCCAAFHPFLMPSELLWSMVR